MIYPVFSEWEAIKIQFSIIFEALGNIMVLSMTGLFNWVQTLVDFI